MVEFHHILKRKSEYSFVQHQSSIKICKASEERLVKRMVIRSKCYVAMKHCGNLTWHVLGRSSLHQIRCF